MAASCVMIPSVKNPKTGALTESALFKDLLKYTNNNRELSKSLYKKTLGDRVKELNIPKDSLGEVTLEGMLNKFSHQEVIPDSVMNISLSKDVDEYDSSTNKKKEYYTGYSINRNLAKKAIAFNKSNRFANTYTASVAVNTEERLTSISFSRTSEETVSKKKIEKNEELYTKLENILRNAGIGIKVMDKLDITYANAYTDFTVAEKAASGMLELIHIANTQEGWNALPEEFSHVILEMLGEEHPLVSRLYRVLKENFDIVPEIMGEKYPIYVKKYKSNDLLIREAAAKLMADAIVGKIDARLSGIINRLYSDVLNKLNKIDILALEKAIIEAGNLSKDLGNAALSGTLYGQMSLEHVRVNRMLYDLKTESEALKDLLTNYIGVQMKLELIRKKKYEDVDSNELLSTQMTKAYADADYVEGIVSFLNALASNLGGMNEALSPEKFEERELKEKFMIINRSIQLLKATDTAIGYINMDVVNTPLYKQQIKKLVDTIGGVRNSLNVVTTSLMYSISIQKLTEYENILGDLTKIPIQGGHYVTIEQLLKYSPEDLGIFEMWVSSASASTDAFLRIMHRLIKEHKGRAWQAFVEYNRKIQDLGLRAEKDGITDWSFMYQKRDGKIVPRFIQRIDLQAFADFVKAKGLSNHEINTMLSHTFAGVKGFPDLNRFASKEFLALTEKQKKYYVEYMTLKASLDKFIPGRTSLRSNNHAGIFEPIFVRKTKMDRLVENGVLDLGRGIRDSFISTAQDIDIQDMEEVLTDFSRNPVLTVPLNYVRMGENDDFVRDYNLTDGISNLSMYAHMAFNFKEMRDIIDFLETTKEIAAIREIQIPDKGETLTVTMPNGEQTPVQIKALYRQGTSNFLKRYYSMLEDVVYGIGSKSQKIPGTRIETAKIAGLLGGLNGAITMSLNLLNSTSNILNGLVQHTIEGAAAKYFGFADITAAEAIYMANAGGIIADNTGRIKTNKVSLANQLFNTIQGFRVTPDTTSFNKQRWVRSFLDVETLSVGNTAGEHFLHSTTMIAVLSRRKLRDSKGNTVNLWDALKVESESYNDSIKKLGLKLGEYTDIKTGKKIETEKDFRDLVNKLSLNINGINQQLFGIYNTLDKSHAQRYSLGVLVLMYRKWLAPALDRRYGAKYYNYDLEEFVYGYHRSTGKFLFELTKDLFKGQLDIMKSWETLDELEKKNFWRSFTEIALALLLTLLGYFYDDEDKPYSERTWGDLFLEYTIRRLATEINVMIPSPYFYFEFQKIMSTPIVALQTMQHTFNLVGLLNPNNYESYAGEEAIIESGRFKGMSKAQKIMFRSPFTLFVPNIEKAIHPEYNIEYFKKEQVR